MIVMIKSNIIMQHDYHLKCLKLENEVISNFKTITIIFNSNFNANENKNTHKSYNNSFSAFSKFAFAPVKTPKILKSAK